MQYLNAIKSLKKKYYFTPFLFLAYLTVIVQGWKNLERFIRFGDFAIFEILTFVVTFLFAYKLVFVSIIFYPHASFFIQTTALYKKVFGSMGSVLSGGLFNYTNIGKNIPDDYKIRSSRGNVYTVSASHKSKVERVSDKRTTYSLYFVFKFIFKDLILRLFTHYVTFVISPILFLIAIPQLKKKGLLENLEKQ